MMKETLATSITVESAVQQGAIALGCDVSEVQYDVLEEPKRKGFLGLGGKSLAKVRVYFQREDTPEEAAAKAEAIAKQEKKAAEKAARAAQNGRGDRAGRADRSQGERRQDRPKREAGNRPSHREDEDMPPMPQEPKREKVPADPNHPAVKLVATLLADLGIEATISLDPTADGSGARHLDIDGEAASVLIGHHGETLDALQYLANLALHTEKTEEIAPKVKVDIEGYRRRREATLRRLAWKKAQQVLRMQKDLTLEPMNPYERRIIHAYVQKIEGVSTHSVGAGASRRVMITYGADTPAEVAPDEGSDEA